MRERFYKSDLSRGKDKGVRPWPVHQKKLFAHDEHINVVSTEGVGTEFIFHSVGAVTLYPRKTEFPRLRLTKTICKASAYA